MEPDEPQDPENILDDIAELQQQLFDLQDRVEALPKEALPGPPGPPGESIKGPPGETPTLEDLEAIILPLIPDPIPGEPGKPAPDWTPEFKKLRTEILQRSGNGGNLPGRQWNVNSSVLGQTFLDVNIIAPGATIAKNPQTKKTDLTLPTGGSGTPAAPDTSVQFNDGGSFGGDEHFLWDKGNQRLTLSGENSAPRITTGVDTGSGAISGLVLSTGNGGISGGDGGALNITSGSGIASGAVGGVIQIVAGDSATDPGADVLIVGGANTGTGNLGATVRLKGGDNSGGGQVIISGGLVGTSDANGGSFVFQGANAGGGTGNGGTFEMDGGNGGETAGPGGGMSFNAGSAIGTGPGGDLNLNGGQGGTVSGKGGSISLIAGSAQGGDSDGGTLNLQGGDASGVGFPGNVNINAGDANATDGNGAFITLKPGQNGGGAGIDGQVIFRDASTNLGALFDISLLSSSDKTFTFPDQSGTFALAGKAQTTDADTYAGRTSDIGSTTLTTTGAGLYRVAFYLVDTAADLTAGAVRLNVSFTDDAASQTLQSSAVLLTTLGTMTQGQFVIQLASGNLTYTTSHTGIFGTATYNLFITCERLL